MKRFLLLLATAFLAVADVPAERMSLLDLISGGSRRSSRSRQKSASRRQRIQVEHDAQQPQEAATNSIAAVYTTNAAPAAAVISSVAAEAAAATNDVNLAADDAIAPAATNIVAQASSNAVERVMPKRESKPAHISSNKVYYDRKDGYAVFTGKVHVDSEEYQMHAQKAYVFFEGTNELKRVVAVGNVAITNDTKRAYGSKASYYRKTGMVVLYGDDKTVAEVHDTSKDGDQTVKGSKIKFWIDSEQVEVIDARISAPVSGGLGELKNSIMQN